MWPWLKDLLYNKATFEQYARVAVFLAGELMTSLAPNSQFWWAGKIVQGLSLVLRAGDKNLPTTQGG